MQTNKNYCICLCLLLQGYYPSNKPGVEPRRPCRPINITPWLHLSNASNRVTITWGNFGKVSLTQCGVRRKSTRAHMYFLQLISCFTSRKKINLEDHLCSVMQEFAFCALLPGWETQKCYCESVAAKQTGHSNLRIYDLQIKDWFSE